MPSIFIYFHQMFGILIQNLYFQDKESVRNLVKLIDKCHRYIFTRIKASAVDFSKIVGLVDWDYYRYPFLVIYSKL